MNSVLCCERIVFSILPHTMPPDSPTNRSKEINVEIDLVQVRRPSKPSKRALTKTDSRQNDKDMASAKISALQKSMEQGFSRMAESSTTALTQTLEIYVCEKVTENDLTTINCQTPHKIKSARRWENRLYRASRWVSMPRSITFFWSTSFPSQF